MIKKCLGLFFKTSIESQRIFLVTGKDYGVRILNPLEIIGRSLKYFQKIIFKFCSKVIGL